MRLVKRSAVRNRFAVLILGLGGVLVVAWIAVLVVSPAKPPAMSTAELGRNAHYVLSDTEGHAVTERSFPGRLRLVSLGFTSCAEVCPATLAKIKPALAALGPDADRVLPVFVGVDPERDTRERLNHYVRVFDPRIIGVTGSRQQLEAFMRSYGLYVHVGRHSVRDVQYTVDHSSSLLVIGPDGTLLDVIDSDVGPADLALDLRRHLQSRVPT
jgi:protein SCO1/2